MAEQQVALSLSWTLTLTNALVSTCSSSSLEYEDLDAALSDENPARLPSSLCFTVKYDIVTETLTVTVVKAKHLKGACSAAHRIQKKYFPGFVKTGFC